MSFGRTVLIAVWTVIFASGQIAPTSASLQYPLAMNTRWIYDMRQEFGPVVHPSRLNAALLKGRGFRIRGVTIAPTTEGQ
jgi:hypothetical protein